VEHLPDPRAWDVTPVEEGRRPSVPILRQRQVAAVALHADDDEAEAGPQVEPGVEQDELADELPLPDADGSEGGDEERGVDRSYPVE